MSGTSQRWKLVFQGYANQAASPRIGRQASMGSREEFLRSRCNYCGVPQAQDLPFCGHCGHQAEARCLRIYRWRYFREINMTWISKLPCNVNHFKSMKYAGWIWYYVIATNLASSSIANTPEPFHASIAFPAVSNLYLQTADWRSPYPRLEIAVLVCHVSILPIGWWGSEGM